MHKRTNTQTPKRSKVKHQNAEKCNKRTNVDADFQFHGPFGNDSLLKDKPVGTYFLRYSSARGSYTLDVLADDGTVKAIRFPYSNQVYSLKNIRSNSIEEFVAQLLAQDCHNSGIEKCGGSPYSVVTGNVLLKRYVPSLAQ
jgi:hypothetical protein